MFFEALMSANILLEVVLYASWIKGNILIGITEVLILNFLNVEVMEVALAFKPKPDLSLRLELNTTRN